MEKIGFVGTGAMGSALLSRLKLAGGSAIAFDIAPAAMEAARKEGAEAAPSAKAVAGDPETVTKFLQAEIDVSAANYLVGQFGFGDLSLAESLRSVRLFSDHVMPKLTGTS